MLPLCAMPLDPRSNPPSLQFCFELTIDAPSVVKPVILRELDMLVTAASLSESPRTSNPGLIQHVRYTVTSGDVQAASAL